MYTSTLASHAYLDAYTANRSGHANHYSKVTDVSITHHQVVGSVTKKDYPKDCRKTLAASLDIICTCTKNLIRNFKRFPW